jgi:hypothetical protein
MEEVIPYFEMFDKIYCKRSEQPTLKQLNHMRDHGIQGGPSFTKWFRTHVIYLLLIFMKCMKDCNISSDLRQLAHGQVKALEYSCYDFNGYRFWMAKLQASRPFAVTCNNGVVTSGEDASGVTANYYGIF